MDMWFVAGPPPVPSWADALPDEVELPRLVEPAPVLDPALAGDVRALLADLATNTNDDVDGM